jgi:hypothetical protein
MEHYQASLSVLPWLWTRDSGWFEGQTYGFRGLETARLYRFPFSPRRTTLSSAAESYRTSLDALRMVKGESMSRELLYSPSASLV